MSSPAGMVLLAILAAGAILRAPGLASIPPYLNPDEAIQGLQGAALRHGESLPADRWNPFPRWPVWCALEAGSTGLLGDSVAAIRLPAVLAGLFAVWLAFPVGRLLAGTGAGLAAAAFLSLSFWHVIASRVALPCVLVTAETLAIGLLLLRPAPLSWKAGVAAAVISGVASLGYAASLVTPLLALFFVVLRLVTRPAGHREWGMAGGFAAAGIPAAVAAVISPVEGLIRTGVVGLHTPAELAQQGLFTIANFFLPVSAPWGYYSNVPPGAPRFAPAEAILLSVGAFALVRGTGPARWLRVALAGWLLLSIVPEVAGGGGIHLIRGLPLLAPAVLIAGLGASWAIRLFGRAGGAAVAVILLLGGVHTGVRTFGPGAAYRAAASWPSVVEGRAAGRLLDLAGRGKLALYPPPDYARSPVLMFHLLDAIREGRITGTPREPVHPRVIETFRDPADGQPAVLLLASSQPLSGRVHAGLVGVSLLLAPGREALRQGRFGEAAAIFGATLALAPDSAAACDLLRRALSAQKRSSVQSPGSRVTN